MKQRFFQWIVGERRGEVVFFDSIVEENGLTYILFKDDSRINSELVAEINQENLSGKMMAEVESYNNIWSFKEEESKDESRIEQDWESQTRYEIPSANDIATADMTGSEGVVNPRKKKKIIKLIPPRKTINKFGRIANTDDLSNEYNESIISQTPVPDKTPEVSPVSTKQQPIDDPVYIMMEKSKKVDTEINMSLTISLPSRQLFDVIKESFDEGDKKALEYIIENIDITNIKESLRAGIADMYELPHWEGKFTNPNEIFEPETIDQPVISEPEAEKKEDDHKKLKSSSKNNQK